MRREVKKYRSALDRLRRREDKLGRTIWVEKMGRGGKPTIYYVYDSHGRLMMHKRIQYGYAVEPQGTSGLASRYRSRSRSTSAEIART